MAIDPTDEVRVSALVHYSGVRDSAIPLIVLQYRPHAVATAAGAAKMAAVLRQQLMTNGWESPVLMVRGGHLATSAQVSVSSALGTGNVVITEDELLYSGPLTRPPGWADIARRAGSVGVIAGFDPSMDDPDVLGDLDALAEKGLLLAAYGKLTPAATGVNPLFRRPPR